MKATTNMLQTITRRRADLLPWDIGAHSYDGAGTTLPEEFDVAGATYYAVAPTGYSYDGTQDTNYSSRKYNTLSAAASALASSPSTPLVINIIGDWTSDGADTTAVSFSGITTSASNYVLVRAIGDARHAGVWNTGSAYRLYVADSTVLHCNEVYYFRIDGVQLGKSSSSANAQRTLYLDGGIGSQSGDRRVSNCILRQSYSNTYYEEGILADGGSNMETRIWNCLVYGFGTPASTFASGISSITETYIYGCTVIGGYYCYAKTFAPPLFVAKNCYGGNPQNEAFATNITKTTCALSGTDSDPNTLDSVAVDTSTFTNVTATTEDFRLPAASPLIRKGLNTSGDTAPLDFTTDIAGKPR